MDFSQELRRATGAGRGPTTTKGLSLPRYVKTWKPANCIVSLSSVKTRVNWHSITAHKSRKRTEEGKEEIKRERGRFSHIFFL
ncbi:unnamed protein product [Caretta caretta]